MKKLVLFFCISSALFSCRSYQISTVSSSNTRKTDSTGIFSLENDSILISYNFIGDNSPVNVEIFNKLSEPVYVNWERSSVIIGDRAYSYVDDEIKINGSTSGSSLRYDRSGDSFSNGTISATAKLSKNESFIPPHSKIRRTTNILNKVGMAEIDPSLFKKSKLNYLSGEGQINSREANFTAEDSPFKFKSYITLYTLKDNQPKAFAFQQDFFISNVTKVLTDPKDLIEYSNSPGNVILNAKTTGYGKTMAVVGLVTAVGALSVADNALEHKEKQK